MSAISVGAVGGFGELRGSAAGLASDRRGVRRAGPTEMADHRSASRKPARRRRSILVLALLFAVAVLSWSGVSVLGSNPQVAVADAEVHQVPVGAGDGAVLMNAARPALIEHRVVPGETLWSMASSIAGDDDPRAYVHRIQRLNGLYNGVVHVGDVVLLPNGSWSD